MNIDKYYRLHGVGKDIVLEEVIVPERNIGRWIYLSDGYVKHYECSECGHPRDDMFPFCEKCGARMEP